MKKKLLIFGKNGFVAKELKILLLKKKIQHHFISSKEIDLIKISSAKKLLFLFELSVSPIAFPYSASFSP